MARGSLGKGLLAFILNRFLSLIIRAIIPVVTIETLRKNNEKKPLSRGVGGITGRCPYFFGMSLLVYIDNQ